MTVIVLLAVALLAPSPDYTTEDVRYPSGDLELAALLMIPEDVGVPVPGAVIIQGSGDSDRTNGWARLIAEELVTSGVAVLLTDKRGSGASEGSWLTADFGDLAGDALAGFRFLQRRDEVDPTRVGVVGLSQGGWVAPITAARSDEVAFVVNVSGTSVSFVEQSFHEMANTTLQTGLPEMFVSEVLTLNRAAGRYLITGNWEAYADARAAGMERPWRPIAEGFPGTPHHPSWGFLRGVIDFDPMPYWASLSQPVLVVYGAEDERDNVPVAESVRRLEFGFGITAKENYEVVVVPDAGHALLVDGGSRLAPEFTHALSRWLSEHVLPGPH